MSAVDFGLFTEEVTDPGRSANLVLDHERDLGAIAPVVQRRKESKGGNFPSSLLRFHKGLLLVLPRLKGGDGLSLSLSAIGTESFCHRR